MSVSTDERPVICEFSAGVARIILNRPHVLNAIDASFATAFHDACIAITRAPEVRVVVVSGNGRGFLAGGDLAQFQRDAAAIPELMIQPMHEGLLLLSGLGAPVIASLHGAVAGAGLSLAAACDLAIAADDVRFSLAYPSVGVSSDLGASWTLPRLLGLRRALQLALLDTPFGGDEALRLGLINFLVPAASLQKETERLVARIAAQPPLALASLKRLMRESYNRDFAAQLDAERESFRRCASSADSREAVASFLEKRPGKYLGR